MLESGRNAGVCPSIAYNIQIGPKCTRRTKTKPQEALEKGKNTTFIWTNTNVRKYIYLKMKLSKIS